MRPITNITILGARLGVIALVVYWIAIFVGTHLPKLPEIAPQVSDKAKHAVAYFGLGLLGCYVSGSSSQTGRSSPRGTRLRFVVVAMLGVIYAAVDEWSQGMVPGRTPDYQDFLADLLGLAIAIGGYAACKAIWSLWKRRTFSD